MLGMRFWSQDRLLVVSIVGLLSGMFGSACSDPDMPKNVVVLDDAALDTDSGMPGSDVLDSGGVDAEEGGLDAENGDVALDTDVDKSETDADIVDDGGDPSDVVSDMDVPNPYPRCGPVVDLGWLQAGQQTLSIDFSMLEDHLATGCPNAKAGGHEAVFSFRLSDEGTLNLTSSSPVASELRRSPCESDAMALFCREDGLSDKVAGSGVWFLVVEQLAEGSADVVEIDLELAPTPACDDVGTARCVDANTIEKCDVTESSPDLARLSLGVCAQGCVGNRCLGDSCEAPIVVTGRIEVEGDSEVYFDTHDSRAGESCHEEENAYLEPELVFELPGLGAGDRVHVETVGEYAAHNILFKSSCEASAACVGYFEEGSSVTWEAPADGTYYVIVENGGWTPGDFRIVIEIEQD